MSRPSDAADEFRADGDVLNPRLGPLEWLRWAWRQLTSMRVALFLLLALAVAAVPGSLIPQESADPNGVVQFKADSPQWSKVVDALQGFDVYSSFWFSAIYLLLFVSLIGCVIPRVRHHWTAFRARPPRTPRNFSRLPARAEGVVGGTAEEAVASAERLLRARRYRTERYGDSVSAERGYLRETGNLVFHSALVGILVTVFVGGGFTYTGQRILVTGDTFTNQALDYDSPPMHGRFFSDASLAPYALTLDHLAVTYEKQRAGFGQPLDYTATVTTRVGQHGAAQRNTIKVNSPLDIAGTSVFLLGNGYAPHFTIRNPDGSIATDASVPFQPQDASMQSLGVIKVRNTTGPQFGLEGFLYPTPVQQPDGTYKSLYPAIGTQSLVTLNVYEGAITTAAENDFVLDTAKMTPVAGIDAKDGVKAIQLRIGQTVTLPAHLGTITLDGITRYAAFDIHHDPSQGWVALFVALAVAGLITSLLVPRRRMWMKVVEERDGGVAVEYAALARGDDPGLERAIEDLRSAHADALGAPAPVPEPA